MSFRLNSVSPALPMNSSPFGVMWRNARDKIVDPDSFTPLTSSDLDLLVDAAVRAWLHRHTPDMIDPAKTTPPEKWLTDHLRHRFGFGEKRIFDSDEAHRIHTDVNLDDPILLGYLTRLYEYAGNGVRDYESVYGALPYSQPDFSEQALNP